MLIPFSAVVSMPGISLTLENKEEETYSISLVQTAEVDREMHEIDGKKILTESYTVKTGDYLWRILRDKGLLEKRNFNDLLSLLQKLNRSIRNLDLIYPGETILIPLVITPVGVEPPAPKTSPPASVPLETIKEPDLEYYTIKPGDNLIKVVKRLYDIPKEDLYDEYLNLLKKMNPSIKDLNTVYPGQKVRIPIYSPQVVRLPVKPPPRAKKPETPEQKEALKWIGRQLGEIFTLIGEEWVNIGKHFIPLKAGGQINLNADSYPIVELRNGNRVIVDLYNDLPEKMARLITSSWDNYRIAHLKIPVDLKTSLDQIISLCGYDKVYDPDEPLILGGDIPVRITADRIIRVGSTHSVGAEDIVVVNLLEDGRSGTPETIRKYLEGLGIKTVDYPSTPETSNDSETEKEILKPGDNKFSLIGTLLKILGQNFSSNMEIPIYQRGETDFNLIVKADFFIHVGGRDCIIDLSGLGPEIVSLLKEHRFSVLSVTDENPPSTIVIKILELLEVGFDPKAHSFFIPEGSEPKNIRLTIPGIVFRDNKGRLIFASMKSLPSELTSFLAQKGYKILFLTPS